VCGAEGAGGVAWGEVVGCPWVGCVGSSAAEVAGDGSGANVCGFLSVAPLVEGWSFVYFAVHGAGVEPAAVEAGDREAAWLIGVAAAHVAP